MRIVIVGPGYPIRGGLSVINEAMCRAFNKEGHKASIVTYKMQYPSFLFPGKTQLADGPPPEGLEIHVLMNSVNPINWVSVAGKINKMKPDLVIFRQWIPFMGPSFGTISRFLDKKIKVFTVVDNLYPHEKRPLDKFLTNYFLKTCDGFLTFSRTVKEQLEDVYTKEVLFTPHPMDDNLGNPVPRAEACKYLNINPEKKYLLFFGLVRKYKGLDLLLKSIDHPEIRRLGIQLLVVGEFYDNPEDYYEIIREKGLEDIVQVTNKFVPVEDVKYYFSAADLVTQTYHSATQSGITQIAYNFNCPMLVTNVGGLSEYVPNGKVGYVVEKDTDEISAAIADFFKNNRKEDFVKNVREEKKKYGWDIFVKRVLEMYEKEVRSKK
ncbi:MAG: glycosyl transferase family 1 [Bacteroidetes bacterium]|nr:MAG: glycosyl transferase family 1 [Bacteroidota bacterium]